MKESLGNNIEQQEKPIISVIDWIKSEEWVNDETISTRIQEAKKFINQLPEFEAGFFLTTGFSPFFIDSYLEKKEESKLIEDKVNGKVVVDLGAGNSLDRVSPFFAEMGVKEFVAVDKFFQRSDMEREYLNLILDSLRDKFKTQRVSFDYFKDDMLVFLSKLPDKSANFILNGLDYDIIGHDYWNKLSEELYRTTYDGGIIMGTNSEFHELGEKFKNISPTGMKDYHNYEGVFEKK